jgi:hypothetical protein
MSDITSMKVSKSTLSLFNQRKAEEAGRREESNLTHNEFLEFLLKIYKRCASGHYCDVINDMRKAEKSRR